MVAKTVKSKAMSCSTPEYHKESSSRDSDSLCDSESESPVPFLCTQDGAGGEIDVVWNHYTPKSEHMKYKAQLKNSTPLSRKNKIYVKSRLEQCIPKRRNVKTEHRKNELLQDLMELQNFIVKNTQDTAPQKKESCSEEDIFEVSPEMSPKSCLKSNSRCLRKNLLSSKFTKPESDAALESDDSMNECLLKASQAVEENILKCNTSSTKKYGYQLESAKPLNKQSNGKVHCDSVIKSKQCESPCFKNDTFDSLMGDLNDSALELLTQMPARTDISHRKRSLNVSTVSTDWTVKELVIHDSPSSKSTFGRYSSMPESPSVIHQNKPSTSGMVFGRYNSMPFEKNTDKCPVSSDSPLKCTPEEIQKKRQQAREKLLAKRQLPFTSQQSTQLGATVPKKAQFRPKVPSNTASKTSDVKNDVLSCSENTNDVKLRIEKNRQEALLKLKRRQNSKKLL